MPSQRITPLGLAGQNHWLFSHSPFVFPGSSRRTERDTLWLLTQSPVRQPVPQPGSELTHNRFAMYMRGQCLVLHDMSQSLISCLKSDRISPVTSGEDF